jgi:mono/diheme cytochrome c family protein
MRRVLRWTSLVALFLAIVGFLSFLYFIPPFLTASPETFSRPVVEAAPLTAGITDDATRAIAEHGREIVRHSGCIGCHAVNGDRGPDYSRYLAGGGLKFETAHGTFVSRNLTPDKDTGLARRTDREVKRVIRSGVFPDGHVVPYTVMPWGAFSNLTDEDLHAVVVYLRHLPPVRNQTPEPDRNARRLLPGALEQAYGGRNYSVAAGR